MNIQSRTARSFRNAGKGFGWAVFSQPNVRIDLAALLVVLAAGLIVGFSALEFAVLAVCCAIVLAAELFNTAIEVTIDYLHPEQHPSIGRAKDVAAGAVLTTAAGAALAGIALFGHHLLHWR